ncbi:hypothetical protein B0H13DRAFT_2335236 [Mycena leptocephala]|nr:hypothetical protein B0H13DRAFT_2335236 [Mycena leptocephala]
MSSVAILDTQCKHHVDEAGLSDSLTSTPEVGCVTHLNIGAGRIVWQDIVQIDVSIKKCQFHKNETILESLKRAKAGNGRLHLLGAGASPHPNPNLSPNPNSQISEDGVHSHIIHLYALLEAAKEQGVPTSGARAGERLEGIKRTKVGGEGSK